MSIDTSSAYYAELYLTPEMKAAGITPEAICAGAEVFCRWFGEFEVTSPGVLPAVAEVWQVMAQKDSAPVH